MIPDELTSTLLRFQLRFLFETHSQQPQISDDPTSIQLRSQLESHFHSYSAQAQLTTSSRLQQCNPCPTISSNQGRYKLNNASWLTATCQFCPTDLCQLHPVEISFICLWFLFSVLFISAGVSVPVRGNGVRLIPTHIQLTSYDPR